MVAKACLWILSYGKAFLGVLMTQQIVRKYSENLFVTNEWFVARITAVGSATGSGACQSRPYAWIEQRVCNNGNGYQDIELNSRPNSGGVSQDQAPAFPIGDGIAQVGDIVLMRARGINPDGYPIMEFLPKSGGGSGGGAVSSVQCVGNVLYVTYG